ncbi:MAG: mechanosensitive ion channel family protein [Acholeplasmataceae bacterium]|nr:mechanosensitive ion channel family protein [Acholeplasmataceae bacterium]MDD4193645.1 mechanosensitive ion channel family protein [Acholeplasmataceae bacterium]
MKFKDRPKSEKTRMILTASIIILFVLISVFAGVIFPGSGFANIIDNSIGKFFNLFDFVQNRYVTILESVAIIVFIWILDKVLIILVAILTREGKRSETIGNLMKSFVQYLMVLIAIFLILSAWGVQTPTLLAGAGILGLAISFGAQSLMEDIFSGLFIIFERQFEVGDYIEVIGHEGIVKEISLRITKIENLEGDIVILNNSDIRSTINSSSGFSPAICDISISYSADIEKVEKIIHDHLEEIKSKIPAIKGGIYYKGVQSLGESSVVLRIIGMVEETDKRQTARNLNRELKILFDKNNIEIPFNQLVIHQANKE